MICQVVASRQLYFPGPEGGLWLVPAEGGTIGRGAGRTISTQGAFGVGAAKRGEPALRIVVFHKILIGTAALFGLGFSAWEVFRYRQTGDWEALVTALAALCVSGLLGYYLRHLKRYLSLS